MSSPSQLWMDLFKGALAGSARDAATPRDARSPRVTPEALAEAAGRIADAGVSVVQARRGVEQPVDRLLRAVEGIGLYSSYPEDLQARLRAVYDAASLVKSARGS